MISLQIVTLWCVSGFEWMYVCVGYVVNYEYVLSWKQKRDVVALGFKLWGFRECVH